MRSLPRCGHCAKRLPPPKPTGRAQKYCDVKCRKAAAKVRDSGSASAGVSSPPNRVPAPNSPPAPAQRSQLDYLLELRDQLHAQLGHCPIDKLAALSKELRVVLTDISALQETESLTPVAQKQTETKPAKRKFGATAI